MYTIKHLTELATELSKDFLASSKVSTSKFTFKKIADTSTPIPEGRGEFDFFFEPCIDGRNVAFAASGSGGQEGVYTNVGGSLSRVADTSCRIPDDAEKFSFFSEPSISGNYVVFSGFRSGGLRGVYTNMGGTLQQVVDTCFIVPGTPNKFSAFWTPCNSGSNVAFEGEGIDGQEGVYISMNGSLHRVADKSTPMAGGYGKFTSFFSVSLDGSNVAFAAKGLERQRGVYTYIEEQLHKVVDTFTPIPGGCGNFSSFSEVSLDDNNIAFVGLGVGGQCGIYLSVDGKVELVADTSTSDFAGSGNLYLIESISLNGGNLVFRGFSTSGHHGIYTTLGGSLTQLIGNNMMLDGKKLSCVSASRRCLSGNSIVFVAVFTDGSTSIYKADLVV
jgi:hypothetical protein